MNGTRSEPAGRIPGRTWKSGTTSLVVDATCSDDLYVCAWVGAPNNGPSTLLTSQQLREIAAEFLERAEVLDNTAGRNRKTPAWHLREGEKRLSNAARHVTEHPADMRIAEVDAAVAQGHFLAALAAKALITPPHTVVNTTVCTHTRPSREDNE